MNVKTKLDALRTAWLDAVLVAKMDAGTDQAGTSACNVYFAYLAYDAEYMATY